MKKFLRLFRKRNRVVRVVHVRRHSILEDGSVRVEYHPSAS